MSQSKVIIEFSEELQSSLEQGEFVKLILQKRKLKNQDLKSIDVFPENNDGTVSMKFLYHYKNKDVENSHNVEEGVNLVVSILGTNFLEAYLYSVKRDVLVKYNKKLVPKMQTFKPTYQDEGSIGNTERELELDPKDNVYLTSFGIVDQRGEVNKNKTENFDALNDYIKLVNDVAREAELPEKVNIVEICNGQGLYSFVLYDLFMNLLNIQVDYQVYETDENLIKFYNNIADKTNFTRLNFSKGDFESVDFTNVDIAIGLFTEDTLTDKLINNAVRNNVKVILSAPLKDEFMAKHMDTSEKWNGLLKSDILQRKQAAILTNGIRSLLLESRGYKNDVTKFVVPEYPQHDLIITALHNESKSTDSEILKQIDQIKKHFGINRHYLEEILQENT